MMTQPPATPRHHVKHLLRALIATLLGALTLGLIAWTIAASEPRRQRRMMISYGGPDGQSETSTAESWGRLHHSIASNRSIRHKLADFPEWSKPRIRPDHDDCYAIAVTMYGWPWPTMWHAQAQDAKLNWYTDRTLGGIQFGPRRPLSSETRGLPLRFTTAGASLGALALWATTWFTLLSLPSIARWTIRRIRPRPGHCTKCGYDLRATSHERCPECGHEPEDRPASPS